MSGLKGLQSVSREGKSIVAVSFDWGIDIDFAALAIREKIDLVKEKLPKECEDPVVLKFDPLARPILILSLTSSLPPDQLKLVNELEKEARHQAGLVPELDALARNDRMEELEAQVNQGGMESVLPNISKLVDLGLTSGKIEELKKTFSISQLASLLNWLAATYAVHTLLSEIGQGAKRISAIVKALKSYAYLDQAPMQAVDLKSGLEDTLLLLGPKLRPGISVRRDYAEELPPIQGYGSELNQVWTNILDNAIDAMDGKGEIVIRTRKEGERAVVEIEDNGPGIPKEIQGKVFDAFFTTKPPGKGTGLGLNISYNIVVYKHRGDIRLSSEPGKTQFQVYLPII